MFACQKRAIDGTRTRDPRLGKPMLYQLSHYRIAFVMQKYDLSATSPKIEANFTFFNSIFVANNRKRVYLCSANGTQIIILYEETGNSNSINHKKTLKMKKKFICTVCGYIYEGEELGITNPGYTDISQYQDVESTNYYRILMEEEGKTREEALEIIGARSRDNGRTPMQWDGS